MTHSTHFINGFFYVTYMVKDHLDSERGNPLLLLHGLLLLISRSDNHNIVILWKLRGRKLLGKIWVDKTKDHYIMNQVPDIFLQF